MKRLFLFFILTIFICNSAFARKTGCEGDCENGTGTWTYTDKTVYVGEWRGSLKHGEGVETWPNRYIYTGEFVDSKRQGQGTINMKVIGLMTT